MDIDTEDYPYALIIFLPYSDRVLSALTINKVESITEAFLGPQGERWSLTEAKKDMCIELQQKGDLYRLCAHLDDLGHGHLFDQDSIWDRAPDDEDADAATS